MINFDLLYILLVNLFFFLLMINEQIQPSIYGLENIKLINFYLIIYYVYLQLLEDSVIIIFIINEHFFGF